LFEGLNRLLKDQIFWNWHSKSRIKSLWLMILANCIDGS
jgi:hypothetical protein